MASTSVSYSPERHDSQYDVIIVGSGLTGLTAAYNILKKHIGLTVLILEKNESVGGRILPENTSQSFHGNFRQNNIGKLITELEIKTVNWSLKDGNNLLFCTKDGPMKKISWLVSCQVYYFLKRLQAISIQTRYKSYVNHEDNRELAKIGVNELIERMVYLKEARNLCRSLLNICIPGIQDLNNVSAFSFLAMLHSAGGLFDKLSATMGDENNFFVKGGFLNLVKTLERRIIAEEGIIKCCENVVKIESTNDRAKLYVTTESKKFKCDYVVIAVPPPCNTRIVMEPSLPELLINSQKLYETGKHHFFFVTYREAFWPSVWSGGRIISTDECNFLTIYDATHPDEKKQRTLAGFSTNSSINNHNPLSNMMQLLNTCWGTTEACHFVTSEISDRTISNPVNMMIPNSLEHHLNPMFIILDKIVLAASEYATVWPGTADGAIEAGGRAACSILLRARPQALDRDQITEYTSNGHSQIKSTLDKSFAGMAGAHAICLGLNVCLFFFLLREAYENAF